MGGGPSMLSGSTPCAPHERNHTNRTVTGSRQTAVNDSWSQTLGHNPIAVHEMLFEIDAPKESECLTRTNELGITSAAERPFAARGAEPASRPRRSRGVSRGLVRITTSLRQRTGSRHASSEHQQPPPRCSFQMDRRAEA